MIIKIFFVMFVISILGCILVTVIEKYTEKLRKFIKLLKIIISFNLFALVFGLIGLMILYMFLFIITINYRLFNLFLNNDSSQYLSLVITFVIVVYFGDKVIDLFINFMGIFQKSEYLNVIREVSKKILKYIKLKKVLYGAVVIFTIISTVISLEGISDSILCVNTSVLLQSVVTFIAIDTFIEKVSFNDLMNMLKRVKYMIMDDW
ncbi:hypothetical protein [Clostridium perfringens]|uniref:hypothetical protein n=1 Tax=Clostridium perfringens TaxID=1502 RepID=UPI002A332FB0|nr:hypothetical protein [Clostridium perfringens]MDM0995537.1 hypothetical protein [Clostridium perfringens]MDZ4948896.1 hypothetical protein [Clostridium perfringens]MDZ5043808.1 hypothetical protein [Clostridium perfringens]MDZ5063669.1 hypothetical protein [Clostridium perfringens]